MADEVEPPLRDITQLVWPFPKDVIKKNPSGGGDYVPHPIVEQRLIFVLGRPPKTEVISEIRGWVAPEQGSGKPGDSDRKRNGRPALENALVGVVLRMTVTIDGEEVSVEEAGDCEDPHNWKHDGQRAKDAFSDAYKRCAMRLGVGLHLWTKEPKNNYTVHKRFIELDRGAADQRDVPEVPDTTPIDTTGHEADDSPPQAASEPSTPPEVPQAQEEASQPAEAPPLDRTIEIDWPSVAKNFGVTQATAITEARALADELIEAGQLDADKKPGSLRHIPDEMTDALYARFAELAGLSPAPAE